LSKIAPSAYISIWEHQTRNMNDDAALLKQYACENDERAFGEIVRRYYPLVYRTAYAKTGDYGIADDVATAVFMLLANRSRSIGAKVVLAGWLYRTAHLTACNTVRVEQNRKKHEAEAVKLAEETSRADDESFDIETLSIIDNGLMKLSDHERNAVLLQYAEGLSIRETSEMLNISFAAAEKRSSRGLDRLRRHCAARAGTLTIAIIAAALGENSAHAAPPVANIIHAARASHLVSSSSIHAIYQGAIKQMVLIKLKGATAIVGSSSFAVIRAQEQKQTAPARVSQATKQNVQETSPALLSDLQLPDGFTLKYSVISRDLMNQKERELTLKQVRDYYDYAVQSGTISKVEAEKHIKSSSAAARIRIRSPT